MADQDGMRAGGAIARLAGNPYPPEAFHRGDYHRLRAGAYRVACMTWSPSGASPDLHVRHVLHLAKDEPHRTRGHAEDDQG
jgi:hypothetical protein